MKNNILQEKRLAEAIKLYPQIKVLNRLGEGNKGEAYLLENGRVLKITIDKEEYSTAMILKKRQLKHIVNIYDGWSFECEYDEEYSDNLFAIIEEYIDVSSKKEVIVKFVSIFRHAWFCIYFPDVEYNRNATFKDLNEYMRNPEKYSEAINFTKRYILSEGEKLNKRVEFEHIYDQLLDAYVELHLHAPNSNLDLNDGNIGFTTNEVLKVFDMQ